MTVKNHHKFNTAIRRGGCNLIVKSFANWWLQLIYDYENFRASNKLAMCNLVI